MTSFQGFKWPSFLGGSIQGHFGKPLGPRKPRWHSRSREFPFFFVSFSGNCLSLVLYIYICDVMFFVQYIPFKLFLLQWWNSWRSVWKQSLSEIWFHNIRMHSCAHSSVIWIFCCRRSCLIWAPGTTVGGPLPLIGSEKVSSRIVDSIYLQTWLLIKSEETRITGSLLAWPN